MQILTSSDLLKQQLEQAMTPKKKAKGVEPSKSLGISYNAELQKLVRAIKKDIDSELVPMLRKLAPDYTADARVNDSWVDDITAILNMIVDKWRSPAFKMIAQRLASKFVRSADDVNRDRFNKDMGRFGIDLYSDSPVITDYISASIFDNTRLITSIADQYLTQVESIVMTNVRAGNRSSAIVDTLRQQFGVSQSRAKMIARDQVSKINANLAEKRQRESGFEYFRWVDSDDSRVRARHEKIADKVTAYGKGIYRYDNPPLSDKGVPIKPGTDFSCRCIGIPISSAEVKNNQKEGRVVPSVKR